MCVYTRIWNKTYCRERLSLGMYGLHVKSRTFITHVYILRLISPFESPWERISIFLQNFTTDRKVIDDSLRFAQKRYPRKCLFPGHGVNKKKKFIPTLPSPVYWTMVRTGNFCNVSPSHQMPSQVTLFFINIKIDRNIDLKDSQYLQKEPSYPWSFCEPVTKRTLDRLTHSLGRLCKMLQKYAFRFYLLPGLCFSMTKMRPSIFFSAYMSVKTELVQLKPKLYLDGGSTCTLTAVQGVRGRG